MKKAKVNTKGEVTQRKKYLLEDLLAGLTPENFHGEIDSGHPVGLERLDDDTLENQPSEKKKPPG